MKDRNVTVVNDEKQLLGFKPGLKKLSREEFRSLLGDTRGGIHAMLRSNEGRNPLEAVEDMMKILFTKYFDEKETKRSAVERKENRPYIFQVGPGTDPDQLAEQVRLTFEAAKKWEKEVLEESGRFDASRRIFDETDQITLKLNTLYQIVEKLQPFSFLDSPAILLGSMFENFLGNTFRDDLGQFFTPSEVIDVIIQMLEPAIDDIIGDPCCGPGRFFTHALDYLKKKNPGIEKTRDFTTFKNDSIFGADLSAKILHVAKINCLLNDAPLIDLRRIDTLDPLDAIADHEDGKIRDAGFIQEGCTLIMTNPPFGNNIDDERQLREFSILAESKKKAGKTDSHVLFIERCLVFLRENGRLGIVVPESLLDNKSNQSVRTWIYRNAQILAVISLPLETFKPYGAGVKTSILFLRKLTAREKSQRARLLPEKSSRRRVDAFAARQDDDHPADTPENTVFMGYINNIGYLNTGDPVDGAEMQDVINAYKRFREAGIDAKYGQWYAIPEKDLFDNRFDVKYHETFPIDRARFPETCSFAEYADVIDEKENPSTNFPDDEVLYISIEELENDPFSMDNPETMLGEDVGSSKVCQGGDVLVARLGPSLANKKSIIVDKSLGTCHVSGEFLVFRPKPGVTPEFLLWLTKSDMFIKQGIAKSTGATPSRYRLHDEFIPEIQVPMYSPDEILDIGQKFSRGRRDIEQKIREINKAKDAIKPDF